MRPASPILFSKSSARPSRNLRGSEPSFRFRDRRIFHFSACAEVSLLAVFEAEDRTARTGARKRPGPVNLVVLYGKVPQSGSISFERQVSSHAHRCGAHHCRAIAVFGWKRGGKVRKI